LALHEPSAQLGAIDLQTVSVDPGDLVRISRHNTHEPFFGRRAANRFDDPTSVFGTCYFGLDLTTALAETVLHDELAIGGRFYVPRQEVLKRFVVRFGDSQHQLHLADLTGPALARLGADGSISTESFVVPQRWAAALHDHPAQVDGLRYVSRIINDRDAVVVFSRAADKLGPARYEPLSEAQGFEEAKALLRLELR